MSVCRRISPIFSLYRFHWVVVTLCLWPRLIFQTWYWRWRCSAFECESSTIYASKHRSSSYWLMGSECFDYILANNSDLPNQSSWSTRTQIFLQEKAQSWRFPVILWLGFVFCSNWRWSSHLPSCHRWHILFHYTPSHTSALGWIDLLPLLLSTLSYWSPDLSHFDFEKLCNSNFPGFYCSHPSRSPSWMWSYSVCSPSRYSLACCPPRILRFFHISVVHVLCATSPSNSSKRHQNYLRPNSRWFPPNFLWIIDKTFWTAVVPVHNHAFVFSEYLESDSGAFDAQLLTLFDESASFTSMPAVSGRSIIPISELDLQRYWLSNYSSLQCSWSFSTRL